jgi:hypothetical protein
METKYCCLGMLADLVNVKPLTRKQKRSLLLHKVFGRFNPRNYTYADDLEEW